MGSSPILGTSGLIPDYKIGAILTDPERAKRVDGKSEDPALGTREMTSLSILLAIPTY
jgi:hypothetical protein